MIQKTGKLGGFFPLTKWSIDSLLGMRQVTQGLASRKPVNRPMPMDISRRAAMVAMKRTRKRLARFLPRHGRLMVR
ncbi:MAG: hypothetical protein OEV92_04345 [Nitrospinota bacterium]|nr:hypothetical protein [Nitrospinota bacterium]